MRTKGRGFKTLQTLVKNKKSKKPDHFMSHSEILMNFFPLITFLIGFH